MQPQPSPTIRVSIQQPALPKYRIPVFRQLSAQSGIELTVLYGQLPGLANAEPDGFSAVFSPIRTLKLGKRDLWWHTPQISWATRRRTDVMILSWNMHYTTLIPALTIARARGVKTILWGHGYSKQSSSLRSKVRNSVTSLATATMFYNHTMADRFVAESGTAPERVFVAPNAIDQAPIRKARSEWLTASDKLRDFQREHGLENRKCVLFISRLEPARRLDMLLQAAARLRTMHPDLHLIIIGDGEERATLQRLAEALGIAESVTFTGALYDEQQLAPWFLSSVCMCFPANMGLSVFHALGYGLPVVTTDNPSAHGPEFEAVRQGQNGMLYQHGSVDSLVEQLSWMLSHPDERSRMSAQALQMSQREYTIEQMVQGFLAAIRYAAATRS